MQTLIIWHRSIQSNLCACWWLSGLILIFCWEFVDNNQVHFQAKTNIYIWVIIVIPIFVLHIQGNWERLLGPIKLGEEDIWANSLRKYTSSSNTTTFGEQTLPIYFRVLRMCHVMFHEQLCSKIDILGILCTTFVQIPMMLFLSLS